MRRELANRDTKEMIKLIAISIVAIVLYLCLSFSNAYGYQVSNLDRLNMTANTEINSQSDTWQPLPSSDLRSFEGYDASAFGKDLGNDYFYDDGSSDGNEVCPAVPEPSIIILFGMGAGSLALYRKFRH